MTLFFYILIGIITFIAFLHAWANKEYDVNRTICIYKPKAEVYAYLKKLNNQPYWVNKIMETPKITLKFRGDDGKPGATFYWKGGRSVGEGVQKITKIKEGKLIETRLLFLAPKKFNILCYMAVKEIDPDKTKMVLGIKGFLVFPASVKAIFYDMDKRYGGDLEESLRNLKNNLEQDN